MWLVDLWVVYGGCFVMIRVLWCDCFDFDVGFCNWLRVVGCGVW